MVCGSCVRKIALRLVRNHKINWIFALEHAEKGLERRRDNEQPKTVTEKKMRELGFDPDYSQSCGGFCAYVERNGRCYVTEKVCSCPSPLANSHYVSDVCACPYVAPPCPEMRSCIGVCYYDCNEGYEWNGEACIEVVAVVPKAGLHPSKILAIILDN